ncbi:PREDICTED: bifunctional 3-dehydroquinate dehydratase/shikimate dehydrogenase, chloroplastic-like [Nicotiana attenuata]|uniref:Bifunctional 3-dehydroquinate dehydrataseshikimate dehydrogenase, chloroplastic n=1 Tax=Nicotiana attenuata TaxID=49451 RepID=A0A314KHU2_NICAT|nr:PREDICTED: bifunctional 3-dehydroquinate dehydratase/shikimate dehydrogenase, chloroplastic-like [Nicotiana attenuata]OIT28748.1 bifunctional 3-dehydroquinate dehydrataseshikimate dehydrogenase, chloroplastic [Nicotiana attenuata]
MGSVGLLKNSAMVCAPLMAPSVEQLVHGMLQAKAQGADLVEIRLDGINNFQPQKDLQLLLNNNPLPVLIVYRPIWEGNEFEEDDDHIHKQLEVLRWAKELGADYIELDLKIASDFTKKEKSRWSSGCKVIASCFVDNVTSKEDLSQVVARMQSTGADILKIVTNANDITELEKMFHLLSHCQVPLIAYSLGERGLISQLLGPKFGSVLVYGSLDCNAVPGLPTLGSLRQAYGVDFLDTDTKVFGLISKPVGHSKGPILHNPTFRHVGYNGIYVPMFVDDLKEFFRVYSSPDFAGFSVGIPYKEAVVSFCDEVDPLAKSIGAVNTIIRRPCDGKLIGYNTDCEASITAIEDALKVNGAAFLPSPLAGKLFVVVGAGGAGRALAFGAKSRRAEIVIFDIDFDRAKALAAAVSGEALPFEKLASFQPQKGAILANATPIGMHPNKDRIPVSEASLKDYVVVFDAVYTPRKTSLLKDAEAAGAITVSGVEMFLRQAIGQFHLFTGTKAPEEFMRDIVMAKF